MIEQEKICKIESTKDLVNLYKTYFDLSEQGKLPKAEDKTVEVLIYILYSYFVKLTTKELRHVVKLQEERLMPVAKMIKLILQDIPAGDSVLIFGKMKRTLIVLQTYLEMYIIIFLQSKLLRHLPTFSCAYGGGLKMKQGSTNVIQRFKQGQIRGLLLHYNCSQGLNLQRANHLILLDKDWLGKLLI